MKRAAGILDGPLTKWPKIEHRAEPEKALSNIFETLPKDVVFKILLSTFQDTWEGKDASRSFDSFCKTRFSSKKTQLTFNEKKANAHLQTLQVIDSYFHKFNDDLKSHLINHKVSLEVLFKGDENKLMQFCSHDSFLSNNTIGQRLNRIKLNFQECMFDKKEKEIPWDNLNLSRLLELCPNVKKLDLDDYANIDLFYLFDTFIPANINSLHITDNLSQDTASILGKCFPHLKKIRCTSLGKVALNQSFPHLTKITLDSGDVTYVSDFYTNHPATFPQITSLRIETPEDLETLSNSVISQPFPHLKKLTMSSGECKEINSDFIISSTMEHLNLSYSFYTKGFLERLSFQAPHLKSLQLSSTEDQNEEYGKLHSSSLTQLLNGCTQLIALDLSDNSGVKEALTQMEGLPQLEFLNLENTELNDEDLFSILSKCPQLKFLGLGRNGITEKGITLLKIKALAPNLKKVYLDHNAISDVSWVNQLQAYVPGELELIFNKRW